MDAVCVNALQFPAGLRVLVVDDDPTCLRILEKMLSTCLYQATSCNRAEVALRFLRDNKNGYDIVISDVHMPDMDGFKLLEHIGLEMDLPVIMMSADDSKSVVMKGITHGACDYLIKPVRMEALKNIWQHVVRNKRKHEENDCQVMDDMRPEHKLLEDSEHSSVANEVIWTSSKRQKDIEDDGSDERDDASASKNPRVVWSVDLHQQFVTAVNQLGIDKAVPKKILELMSVPGLTRENVASHLQKYRLYLRRLSSVSQHPNGLSNTFLGPPDVAFGPISSLNSAFASSGQLQPQSLATIQAAALGGSTTKSSATVSLLDQRHLFSLDNLKLRFLDKQHLQQQPSGSSKKVNLLHGIPENMNSKQLAEFCQSSQPFGDMNMLKAASQQQSPRELLEKSTIRSPAQDMKSSTGVGFSHSLSPDFPRSNFSVAASNSGMSTSFNCKHQDEVNSSEMKGGCRVFIPNYNVLGNLNQDWYSQSREHSSTNATNMITSASPFDCNQWSTGVAQHVNGMSVYCWN